MFWRLSAVMYLAAGIQFMVLADNKQHDFAKRVSETPREYEFPTITPAK